MLFPLVFCLAPPVYMMLLAPAVLELRNFVLQENRPGGVLSTNAERFSDMAAAVPNRQNANANRLQQLRDAQTRR